MKTPEFTACSELEALLPAYADGSLPAAEAARVAEHLPGCPACQHQLHQLRALTADLDAALPEVAGTALRANFMAMLEQQKQQLAPAAASVDAARPVVVEAPAAKVVSMWPTAVSATWLRVAASIVLLAAGIFLGRQLPWGGAATGGSVATTPTATAQPVPDALAAALNGDSGHAVSASNRIQLVNRSGKETEPGDQTVQVLINTLNFDPSPNVRLAACDALYRLRADARVGEALVHSLSIQTDPNVQITLIDMLVTMRLHRAVPQLKRLAKRPDALPVVRAQAEAGVGKLI